MPKQYPKPPEMVIDPSKTYSATIETNHGAMTLQLAASEAPHTVNNFVFLARDGFYDHGTFHRVIKDFMIQGGCPQGTGAGGPGYRFNDEPVTRPYVKGTLAMANAGPNTNGSQFFVVHGAQVSLPPNYTILGMLTHGMEVLDTLANAPVTMAPGGREKSTPMQRLEIQKILITESLSKPAI